MADAHLILSIARIATAALAGTIAVFALRAHHRTQQRSLLALAAGAGLLAAGYFAEGVLVEIAGWTIAKATVLESLTTVIAASLLVASLYLKDRRPSRPDGQRGAEIWPHGSPP